MTKIKLALIVIILAAIAALFGLWLHHNTRSKIMPLQVATVLTQPRALSSFVLTDDNNHTFTQDNLKNHWSLIFFGFTHCPDLCPTSLAELKMMYTQLSNDKQNPMPQIIFISVDPERDTPAVIKRYLSSFNSNFIGVTGSEDMIKQLTQETSTLYMKIMKNDHDSNESMYNIDHSGTILMTNPQGQLIALFTLPHDNYKIAQDVANIIKEKS